jgi:hypothetical protein
VSEVHYNGSPCPSELVDLDAGANSNGRQQTCAGGDDRRHPAVHFTEADGDSRATVSGLLPGASRVTAYPSSEFWGDDPQLKQP